MFIYSVLLGAIALGFEEAIVNPMQSFSVVERGFPALGSYHSDCRTLSEMLGRIRVFLILIPHISIRSVTQLSIFRFPRIIL
jgi:hypothetical protein